jgi:O-antigen/teichoic acid export membrane protein
MLNTLMLGFLSSYEQVGFFSSPNKILSVIISFFGAINIALIPRLAFNRQHDNNRINDRLLQNIFDLHSFLIIPAAIGLCLVSSRLVPVFFGNDFFGSILPMQILSFKMIAVMINSFFANNILMTFGLEKKFVVVVTTTAIVSFLLNLIFIPKFGAIGAAMINLSTESLEIILNLFFVYRLTKIRIKWKSMLQAFLSTLPFLLFYYIFTKIIENDTLFLICFISTSTLLYLFLQLSIFKNPLITQELDRLTRKKRILE